MKASEIIDCTCVHLQYIQVCNIQADKPKQNETEIYKRASEEYITHAQ